jgi:chemotaxis protein CheD
MLVPIDIPTASYAVAKAPDTLATVSIGSCVAICLYSASVNVGALMHCMLPRAERHMTNPYLYTDTAMSNILKELLKQNITVQQLTAKLVGGAQMFPTLEGNNQDIGKRNIDEANLILQVIGIPVIASDVGGNNGRSLVFDLSTGMVTITQALSAEVKQI